MSTKIQCTVVWCKNWIRGLCERDAVEFKNGVCQSKREI